MTDKERFEWMMLPPQLRTVANQLERALKLLEAAEKATRLIDQVRILGTAAELQGGERNSAIATPGAARRHEVDARGVVRPPAEQPSDVPARAWPAATAVGRPVAIATGSKLETPAVRIRASSGFAVFDHDAVGVGEFAKKSAGGSNRPPF